MSEEKLTFPTRRKRKTVGVTDASESVNVELIRNGEWKKVLHCVGPTEYNRLRSVALKK